MTSTGLAAKDSNAYLIVSGSDGHSASVRRVPIVERFMVWVDDEGTLRTDHALDVWQLPVANSTTAWSAERAVDR